MKVMKQDFTVDRTCHPGPGGTWSGTRFHSAVHHHPDGLEESDRAALPLHRFVYSTAGAREVALTLTPHPVPGRKQLGMGDEWGGDSVGAAQCAQASKSFRKCADGCTQAEIIS